MKILRNPKVNVALGCLGFASTALLIVGFSSQSTLEQRVANLETRVGVLEKAIAKSRQNEDAAQARRRCISNLKLIESAKEQWAMTWKKGATDTPTASDLVGRVDYGFLKSYPACPLKGQYTIGNMSTRPTCSLGSTDDHYLY